MFWKKAGFSVMKCACHLVFWFRSGAMIEAPDLRRRPLKATSCVCVCVQVGVCVCVHTCIYIYILNGRKRKQEKKERDEQW